MFIEEEKIMSDKIRAVHVGFGAMGQVITQYMIEKGIEVTGVFNRKSNIGKDLSEITDFGEGIRIRQIDELDEFLKETRPDVCTVSTETLMCDLKGILMSCAENGVNAITIGEEAIYPWNSSPEITAEIDKAARENNCTICGSGYQDIFWGVITSTLAAVVHKAEKIIVYSRYGLNGCGTLIYDYHGCDITVEEFERNFCFCNDMSPEEQDRAVREGTLEPSLMWMMNDWICSKLDLTPVSKKQIIEPVVNDFPVYMEAYGRYVDPGKAAGLKATVTTETEQGVTIETINIGKVDVPGEGGECRWEIIGTPNVKMVMPDPDDIALTCSPLVNRIPALLEAPAGFVTTDRLPEMKLWGNYENLK